MYSGLHKVLAEYDFASAPCILDNPLFAAPTPPCVSDCYDAAFAEYSAEDASTLRNYSYREMVIGGGAIRMHRSGGLSLS